MSFRIQASNRKYEVHDDPDRIYHQVYGNHDFPNKLYEYLVKHNADFDKDHCFFDFEVPDIQELLEVMLEIHNEQIENDSYWDFNPGGMYKVNTPAGLLDYLDYKLDAAIVLQMYNFYKTFENLIDSYWDKESAGVKYKFKDGATLYLSGW